MFTIVGHHIIFHLQQAGIKAEMKRLVTHQLSKNETENLVFALYDQETFGKLNWEGDLEFNFNGEMYDVVSKKIVGDKMIIQCINDKKETILVNKLCNDWKENDRSNKMANELFQLLQTLFHEDNSKDFPMATATAFSSSFLLDKLPSQIKKIPTPPPQFSDSHFISI